jgi:protein tyrosine phosphatase (PTP) superfamily phosphohydrolase (DUF442 family)
MQTKRINEVPGLMYLWQVDNLFIAGQPAAESFDTLKELGVKKILNMRSENECDFSFETSACKRLGLEYIQFPILENGLLIPENCKRLSEMLNETDKWFVHCGSANRIAGWLMTYLPLYRNIPFEEAVEIATKNGLSNPALIEQARKIVEENK